MASTFSSWPDPATAQRLNLPDADRQAVLCPKYGKAMLTVCESCDYHGGYIPVVGNEKAPNQERYRVFCHHPVMRMLRPIYGLSHPVVACPLIRHDGQMGYRNPQECRGCIFFKGFKRRPTNSLQKLMGWGIPSVLCAHATARRFDLVV